MKTKFDIASFLRHGILFITLIIIMLNGLFAQVKISEESWVLPTYKVMPPDKNPMFFKGESYQGASKVIYPYALNDVISNEKADKDWKALILENEYIKLCVTPEIGGKLYYATDKTNRYNYVYKNNVVKPSNIGMTGAWVSGGIEWCVIHHHRASTFLPVDYYLKENADGSKTIWIGETEPRHRMRWTIGMTVFPGKSYYCNEVRIMNPTPFTNTFLFWANVAAHTNKDYQVIFPPSVNTAVYHAKNSFTNWPFSTEVYNGEDFTKGVDISYWENSVNQNSYFAYDLKEDFMGGYDHGKETGTVHIGDHNIVKGAKLWEWGSGEHGQATEGLLTEKDGPYVEIMVGAFSDNQPDYSWIRPGEVKTFKQYWYPVKDIQGFKNANLNGAVNLEKREGSKVFLGYYSTQKIDNARIILKHNEKVIFEKIVTISPEKAYTELITINSKFEMTELSTAMYNSVNNELLVEYIPVREEKVKKLPEEVNRPVLPKDMTSVEELYLTGSRILQFHNPTLNALDYFNEALKRDNGDIRTNVIVGSMSLKNGEYQLAQKYFRTAIKRLTKDYTRPSNCEALYLQGITLKTLERYEDATDTLYRATWDYAWHSASYIELARISCFRGDYQKALEQIEQSLSTNAKNSSAINLRASILRKLGRFKEAQAFLAPVLVADPLDFRAGNELYLLSGMHGDTEKGKELRGELQTKMRNFNQNYLELAVAYLNDFLPEEAEDVLLRFSGQDQMVSYYLGFLQDKKGNHTEAGKYFDAASAQPVDYGFPFRLEDEKVLLTAAGYRPNDAKPLYYLGNLLYDKQPQRAIGYWEKAVKLEPVLAIAWRNLGFGYYHHLQDITKAIEAYEKAFSLNKAEPVYYAELDPLYELNNTPIETRARLFDGVNEIVKQRDDAFVREIMVLNLSDQPEKSVEYLSNSTFHFREGSSRVSDMRVDAHLLLGMKFLSEKKNNLALAEFLKTTGSKAENENADARDSQINYFIGLAYEALGKKADAIIYFTKSASQINPGTGIVSYYQGLSHLKLGNKTKANEIFNALIATGTKRMSSDSDVDFFAKFGEKEAGNVRLSNANLLIGLGNKGLGNKAQANESLQKAVELSASNLWANVFLSGCSKQKEISFTGSWDSIRVLENPEKGWYHHLLDNGVEKYAINNDSVFASFPGMDHLYLRLAWSYLEPEEGKFDWHRIDEVVEKYVPLGYKISFRISSKETGNYPGVVGQEHDGVQFATPVWVKKAGAKGTVAEIWDTHSWVPEWDDPVYLEKLDNFNRAFAAKYDGKPWVSYIDIGSIGEWGEGHTFFSTKIPPSVAEVKANIDIFLKNYKKSQLVCTDDLLYYGKTPEAADSLFSYAVSNGISLRDDSPMVDWYLKNNLKTWSISHPRFYNPLYLTKPIVFELEHYRSVKQEGNWLGKDGDEIIAKYGYSGAEILRNAIRTMHATYIGFHGYAEDWLAENPDLTNELANLCGYWYFPVWAEYGSIVSEGEVNLAFKWINKGIAPAYSSFSMIIRFENSQDLSFNDVTIKDSGNMNWLPGSEVQEKYSFRLSENIAPGDYILKFKLIKTEGKASLPVDLALSESSFDKDNFITLGRVNVTK